MDDLAVLDYWTIDIGFCEEMRNRFCPRGSNPALRRGADEESLHLALPPPAPEPPREPRAGPGARGS